MKIFSEVVVFFLVAVCTTFAQQPTSHEILKQPIIEGCEAAGISLGDTEVEIVRKIGGLPYFIRSVSEKQKILGYRDMTKQGGICIDIFMEDNVVIGIEIMSIPTVQGHIYKGQSTKGFRFGDSPEKVQVLYGSPHRVYSVGEDKILWYKKEGIIFEYFSFAEEEVGKGPPNAVIIIKPDADIPPHIKERGGPEGLWK